MTANVRKLELVLPQVQRDEDTVKLLEAVLSDAKEGKYETVLIIPFHRDGQWQLLHATIFETCKLVGLLTRIIHLIIKDCDG